MNAPRTVRLKREATDQQWGFRLQGGIDCPMPLLIQAVVPHTLASMHGLHEGDLVVAINGKNVGNLVHQDAKMEITRSANELELTVIRGALNQQSMSSPQYYSQIKIDSADRMSTPQVIKPNYTGPNQTQIYHIPSIPHRAEPQPDRQLHAATAYHNDRSANQQSGTYVQEIPVHLRPQIATFEPPTAYNRDPMRRDVWKSKPHPDNPQASVRHIGTAVYHAQYNSPIALYSDDKVLEAFKSQTGHLIDEIKGTHQTPTDTGYSDASQYQGSPTYEALMRSEGQHKNVPHSSEGKISRSFRALEHDLHSVEGTSQLPKSIFDQRH